MKIITKALAVAIAATVALGVGVSPAQAAPKAKKFTSCSAMKVKYPAGVAKSKAAAKRVPGKQKVSKRLYRANKRLDGNHNGVACETRRTGPDFGVVDPGYGTLPPGWSGPTTQPAQVPVQYVILDECRVESESLVADRTVADTFGGSVTYLDGQIDLRYSGTCRATAYDAQFDGHPIVWQDSWTATEYVFTEWDGAADRTAVLLANNHNVIGDVDFRVWEGMLGNVPTTI